MNKIEKQIEEIKVKTEELGLPFSVFVRVTIGEIDKYIIMLGSFGSIISANRLFDTPLEAWQWINDQFKLDDLISKKEVKDFFMDLQSFYRNSTADMKSIDILHGYQDRMRTFLNYYDIG